MKAVVKLAMILVFLSLCLFGQPSAPRDDAYLQNASRVFARQFHSPEISYILMDVRSGATIEAGWRSSGRAIPVGSLVKPFTAIAYAESHGFRFPELTCEGGSACWSPRGHGKLDLAHAIAFSCNSYFTQMGAQVHSVDVATVARRYGLAGPPIATSADGLAGRFGEWRESPRAMIHAYAELLSRSAQPGVRDVVTGMRESARSGTAVAASRSSRVELLAKTGTAPCTHAHHAPGDGFVLLAWPAETPQYVLLVRQHSVPGAKAAILAGKMLHALEPQP